MTTLLRLIKYWEENQRMNWFTNQITTSQYMMHFYVIHSVCGIKIRDNKPFLVVTKVTD
jgi:hypothetical protein